MQEMLVQGAIQEAVGAMTIDAAKHYLGIGQAYAEMYPKPATIELVKPPASNAMTMMRMLGDLAPCGMLLVRWPSRMITWSNNAYKKVFLDSINVETAAGKTLDELIPDFDENGLMGIFSSAAESGEAFSAEGYELLMPTGATYWDWSVAPIPAADSSEMNMVVQLQQVFPAQQRVIA